MYEITENLELQTRAGALKIEVTVLPEMTSYQPTVITRSALVEILPIWGENKTKNVETLQSKTKKWGIKSSIHSRNLLP